MPIKTCQKISMPLAMLLVTLSPVAAGATGADLRFASVKVPAHSYEGGWEHFVGGGLAAFDCNGDHKLDLFAAGGSAPAKLLRNTSGQVALSFEEQTPDSLSLTGVTGAYPLDIDGDGLTDLAVLRVGANLLMRGLGECQFTPFVIGFQSPDKWTTAFSATWETGQTLPTLAFGNYVDRENPDGPFEACDTNALYRPIGDGYGSATKLAPGFCPLSMLISDWGRRGVADLRLSNDRHYYVRGGAEQMWSLDGLPRLYTEAEGWRTHRLWGMGIASRDISGDGLPEVFLTSMGDQRLQRLNGEGPSYEDVPYEMGTTAHRPHIGGDGRPSTGWHVAFGDVQNDGLDDVFIAKGNVDQMPDAAMDDPNSLLVQTGKGRFEEASDLAGVASMHRSRGAVLADFDNDGLLDLAVSNRRAPLEIYHNQTEDAGAWLSIRLVDEGPNHWTVGGFIEVRTPDRIHTREITVGGGHAGGTLGPEHFGLGGVSNAKVRVIWPDGTASDWVEVKTAQRLILRRQGPDQLSAEPY